MNLCGAATKKTEAQALMRAPEEIPMRITIDLRRDEYDRLYEIARSERRPLRDQAAWIVAKELKSTTPQKQEALMT